MVKSSIITVKFRKDLEKEISRLVDLAFEAGAESEIDTVSSDPYVEKAEKVKKDLISLFFGMENSEHEKG